MYKVLKYSFWLAFIFSAGLAYGQGYKNPIIPGFYPDPSVCRVGNDYYLVNSSFEYFPGIPIWHSTDLVHWQQIGNVLNRASQLPLKNCRPSNGIYAPTIRYHNGVFYLTVTLVLADRAYGNFMVKTTNPAGPWSEPIKIDQNGIDPSLFFDDGGKVYFQSNRGYHSDDPRAIYQSEIDIQTGKRLSDIKELWKGSGGSYVEGPHMYKKDGWYYLMTAEGGTAYGHSVAIARSKYVWGPFESNPSNPILTNRMSYSAIQGTGHADLVQAPDGNWWMVHLAFRPAIDGIHFIGRETCLTPLTWNKYSWPIVNKYDSLKASTNSKLPLTLLNHQGQADEFVKTVPFGFQPDGILANGAFLDNFNETKLDFSWIYLRNPDSSNYSLTERKGYLSLRGSKFSLFDLESPTFVGRRQSHFDFSASTTVDFDPVDKNEEAGITLLMTNLFHYDFFISKDGQSRTVVLRYALDNLTQILNKVILPDNGNVELEIKGDKKTYSFYCFLNGKPTLIGQISTRFLGTEVTGGYNGVIIGLYATGNGRLTEHNAFFKSFDYKPLL